MIWLQTLLLFFLLLAVIFLIFNRIEYRLIFKPERLLAFDAAFDEMEVEEISFFASDGKRLSGWWFPHPDAKATVLFCHGNAGNMSGRLWVARDLLTVPVNVFLFDYRGYGSSKGRPSVPGIRKDAAAAYEVVRAKYDDMDHPPVIAMGRSLGGPVATQLALDKPVRALILESTFTSMVEMGQHFHPYLLPDITCTQRFDTISNIASISVPLIMSHGPLDERIPYHMGQELYAKATSQHKQWFELSGSHGDANWHSNANYWNAVVELIRSIDA